MKVLQVINNFGRGGAPRLVKDILVNLKSKGYDIDALVLSSKVDVFSVDLKRKGIAIYQASLHRYDFRVLLWLKDNLMKYDIVHVHLFPSFYWVGLAAYLFSFKGKLVFTEHNTYNSRRQYSWFKHIDQWFYQAYDFIVCINEPVKESLAQWLPKKSDNLLVIENGIDLDRFAFAEPTDISKIARKSIHENILVLMVALFEPRKDQKTLVYSMQYLPEKFHLLLVGSGSQVNKVKKVVKECNLSDRVHFLGFQKDIPGIMKACDVYVQSSNWEGFGLVAVEAMASGLPVVCSNVKGLSDIVANAGLTFSSRSPIDLAQKIGEAYSKREVLSKRAREQSVKFSSETFIGKHISLYESLCKK